jgi:Leucine-rich repeat (LRR) protein
MDKKFAFKYLIVLAFFATACMQDFPAPQNDPEAPAVSVDAETLTRISATLDGSIGAAQDIVSYGFEMTGTNFDDAPDLIIESTGADVEGRFSYTAEVKPGAYYAIRSFISNGHQKKYSQPVTLKVPLTSAATPSEVKIVNNKLIASIVDDGGREIREVGFCWSESSDKKTIRRNRMKAEWADDGTFTADLPTLESGLTYYFLAYAENASGSQEVFGYSTEPRSHLMTDEVIVSIEDAAFFQYLVGRFDKNRDGRLSDKELQVVTDISVSTDQIASVQGIEWMPELSSLDCQGSSPGKGLLNAVDISRNPLLGSFNCANNQLDELDLSGLGALTRLDCSGNQLEELDVSPCFRLEELNCSDNLLMELDLSQNPYLQVLLIRKNPLESIDISLCTELSKFDGTGCPNLERVYVSPDRYETIEKAEGYRIDGMTIFYPIFIPIQDPTLNEYLLSLYDDDGDRRISAYEAAGVKRIEICTNDVRTMAGIEFFYNLEELICGSCDNMGQDQNRGLLTALDVSHNRKLVFLDCHGNRITSLDLSRNEALTTLVCDGNQLKELDCSHNPLMGWISCGEQRIASLNVSDCKELQTLFCASNALKSLDVSQLPILTRLDCGYNSLSKLDVSALAELTVLKCSYNQLEVLDVSRNGRLSTLWCEGNRLTWLDVTHNPDLVDLRCDLVYIPDEGFKDYLISEFDTNGDGEISLAEAWVITRIDVYTDDIYSLQGIESFLNLERLACGGRPEEDDENGGLTELDLSHNTKLRTLDCRYNQITSLDLSHNTGLSSLTCIGNEITSLRLDYLPELMYLDCALNPLSGLDITHNTEIYFLHCQYTGLEELDLSRNVMLKELYCSDNELTELNLANNPLLEFLECGWNEIEELDISNNVKLKRLVAGWNNLSTLDVSNNLSLNYLDCRYNPDFWELTMKEGQEIETLLLDEEDISIIYV